MIIAIVGEKGGTGKTTLAVNMAGLRATNGNDVLLIDADRQGTASYWSEERDLTRESAQPNTAHSGLKSVEAIQKFGDSLYRTALSMSGKFDDVIIDLPSGDHRELKNALDVADVIVMPVRPSGFDAWTVGEMDSKVRRVLEERPQVRAYCVLNAAPFHPRSRERRAVISALSQCSALKYPDIIITDRSVVRQSSAQGLTVHEGQPANKKSEDEFALLYSLIFEPEVQQRNGTSP